MSEKHPADSASRSQGEGAGTALSPDLLDVLVCPLGKLPLRLEGDTLVCRCGLRYAIVDGIPNMLAEEAELPEGVARLEDVRCPPPDA